MIQFKIILGLWDYKKITDKGKTLVYLHILTFNIMINQLHYAMHSLKGILPFLKYIFFCPQKKESHTGLKSEEFKT